jgi:hypothetical protein
MEIGRATSEKDFIKQRSSSSPVTLNRFKSGARLSQMKSVIATAVQQPRVGCLRQSCRRTEETSAFEEVKGGGKGIQSPHFFKTR